MRDIEIDVILRNASALDTRREDSSCFTTNSFYSAPLTRSWEEDRFSSMRFLDNPVRTALAGQMGTSFTGAARTSLSRCRQHIQLQGCLPIHIPHLALRP